jgi:hypothetical protein
MNCCSVLIYYDEAAETGKIAVLGDLSDYPEPKGLSRFQHVPVTVQVTPMPAILTRPRWEFLLMADQNRRP